MELLNYNFGKAVLTCYIPINFIIIYCFFHHVKTILATTHSALKKHLNAQHYKIF